MVPRRRARARGARRVARATDARRSRATVGALLRERARPPALAVRHPQGARAPRPHRRNRRALARTRSGTPTLRICWRGARGCARSRSCSATRPPRRRRSTRTSPSRISCASTPTTTPEADGCRNHRDDRARSPRRARRDLAPVQGVGRPRAPRPADPDLRAARQVRGRQARLVAAAARRGGRPHLVRAARPDRRDRALRAGPRDQVRDLRHLAHPRRDDRRAALARLGAALRAQPRPRDRARDGRAREPPQAHARATRRSPASSASRWASSRRA